MDRHRLTLYLDIKSPYAYLAKDPAKQLERDFDIEIDWCPLTLDIPSFLGSAKVNEKRDVVEENRTPRQWQAVRYAYYDVKRYARLRETLIYGPRKVWDTSLAHLGWLFAKQQSKSTMIRYLDDVFERFWMREFDPESIEDVESALADAGCSPSQFASFASDEGPAALRVLDEKRLKHGAFGVPSFVLDGELFFGREHLPMIRWILGGRNDPAPDIEYWEPQFEQ